MALTYDNAPARMTFPAMDETGRARQIADALVYAQQHDRWYTDGQLRTAYQAGALVLPPGWTPHGHAGTVRMTGWWDPSAEHWTEAAVMVASRTGDLAWALLALPNYYEAEGHAVVEGTKNLTAARMLEEWLAGTTDERGAGGDTGGTVGGEPDPTKLLWKPVEHNLDLYVACLWLTELTENEERATW